jgi:hypothetical protein
MTERFYKKLARRSLILVVLSISVMWVCGGFTTAQAALVVTVSAIAWGLARLFIASLIPADMPIFTPVETPVTSSQLANDMDLTVNAGAPVPAPVPVRNKIPLSSPGLKVVDMKLARDAARVNGTWSDEVSHRGGAKVLPFKPVARKRRRRADKRDN